jgi:DNA topoisomerase-1
MKHLGSFNGDFEPRELARLAKLRYVSDSDAGYSRHPARSGFKYRSARGKLLLARGELKRIETLAIPPAWTDVWICRFATGHLQATGHDDRQRKQYLYHERWRAAANLAKFIRLSLLEKSLPELRRAVSRDLRGRGLTRRRVLAGMVALLDATGIRIGNEEYVRENGSYGLTTLRTRHVATTGRRAVLRFRAKGGMPREVIVEDPQLVRLLKELRRLPGSHIFQYLDDEERAHVVTSVDVNEYLRERTGHPITAKDFRTWKASALAVGAFLNELEAATERERRRIIKASLASSAELLANTVTVCRKYYVHPGLVESYECGKFAKYFSRFKPQRSKYLSQDEQALACFLRRWRTS